MSISKKINPDLEWFRKLPVEKLGAALLFYKPDSEEGISPGYLRIGEDELALGRFLESLGDSPLGDRKEFSKKVLSFLGTLSPDSLVQMRQELSASGLAPYGEEPRPWIWIAAEKMYDAVNGLGTWVEEGIKGLRFLEYNDSFDIFALTCDGEATLLRFLPVRTLSKLSAAVDALREQKEMEREVQRYKDSIYSVLYAGYKVAQPTDEIIGGNFAKDFAGTVSWSRKLDFNVPGYPDVVGLRYINFKDCTNLHVLYKDGNSRPVVALSKTELSALRDGFSKHVRSLKNKGGIKV